MASGTLIPTPPAVTALCLLFEKVYLPNQLELVRDFARIFRFGSRERSDSDWTNVALEAMDGSKDDPLAGLTESQRNTALQYLHWSMRFALVYSPLYGKVFETNCFEGGCPLAVKLIKKGAPDELNLYEVKSRSMMMSTDDSEAFPRLVEAGYIPILAYGGTVGHITPKQSNALGLTALLAMKTLAMALPQVKGAHPELILEAPLLPVAKPSPRSSLPTML